MSLTSKQVEEIRARHSNGEKQISLAREYSVSTVVIWRIIHTPTYSGLYGFANLSAEQRRTAASKGGKAAQAMGKSHRWTREEAQAASRSRVRRLTIKDVRDIKARLAQGERTGNIARYYQVACSTISHIKVGRTWRDREC